MRGEVAAKLHDIAVERLHESFALLDQNGRIKEFGGCWSQLGVTDLAPGCLLEERLAPLIGLFPWRSETESMGLSLLQISEGVYIDLAVNVERDDVYVVVWDVTSKGRALQALVQKRNELKEANDTLERMADELTRAIQEIHLYHAFVGHEIRSASQNVRASVELLATAGESEERQRYVEYALGTSSHLVNLVSESLRMSRLGAKNAPAVVNIEEVLREVIADFAPRAFQKGVELSLITRELECHKALLDVEKLRFVLRNLIGNALKYTERGSVWVDVSNGKEGDKQTLVIEVRDTGPGFTPEQLERSFEPFVSFPRPGADAREGAGLGLFMTKRLVAAMGGRLSAASKPGEGTSFWITLAPPW